ncbi:hypothetical protein [Neisseria sp. Ec49-e6-T10]|uniref:hypothetical protein n=1 Tax=Neisseria sp. Ec49-e6-T10 TaxID=3140744 RepID=UPI003EBA49C3
MSLLFTKAPIVVNTDLACAIGFEEAVVLQQVKYWLKRSKNVIDGKTWVYNSIASWAKQFPFWSDTKVKRIFADLVDQKLLLTANHNKSKMDKTLWYTINDDRLDEIEHSIGSDCTNGEYQDDPMDSDNLTQPIPEITQRLHREDNNEQKNVHPINRKTAQRVVDSFNEITSLPKVKVISEDRIKAIKARWRDLAEYKKIEATDTQTMINLFSGFFKYVEDSDFLSGRSEKFNCYFDWIFKKANFIKILEGNYENGRFAK